MGRMAQNGSDQAHALIGGEGRGFSGTARHQNQAYPELDEPGRMPPGGFDVNLATGVEQGNEGHSEAGERDGHLVLKVG
jgi:hypothetical protein